MALAVVPSLAVCPGCAAPWPREPEVESLAPTTLDPDESRRDWLFAGRIVDGITGAPLPGARLYHVGERSQPEGGTFWSDGCWFADRDGFVRVPAGRSSGVWWIVDAPGYGPIAGHRGPPDYLIKLFAGVDVPVALVDWLDRPVGGAELGYCIGCGHTPDVRVATTDSNGIAWLRCIDAGPDADICDVYVRHPGLSCVYEDFQWRPGDPPVRFRAMPVPDVRGCIRDAKGSPMRGVAVGGTLHRGPWVWTDDEGSFCHVGRQDRDDWLHLVVGKERWSIRVASATAPIEVTLPPPERPAPLPTSRLSVNVRDALTGELLSTAGVWAVAQGIWPTRADETDDGTTRFDATARLDLVPGAYDLLIEDQATFEPVRQTVHMDGTDQRLTIDLHRRPTVAVRLEGWQWDTSKPRVEVVTADSQWTCDVPADGVDLPVPSTGPFALRIATELDHRTFAFDSRPPGPLLLRPHAATLVRARLVDAQGTPLPGRVLLQSEGWLEERDAPPWQACAPDGRVELATRCRGCAFLWLRPVDGFHRQRVLHLALPERGDDRLLDLGDVRCERVGEPVLRCCRSNGMGVTGTVQLERPGLRFRAPLDEGGGWGGLDPRHGDRVTVTIDDQAAAANGDHILVPWVECLDGSGPWTLRQPDAELALEVLDARGSPVGEFSIVVADQLSFGRGGRAVLRGLPIGPVEVFVGANGANSARVRLTAQPGMRERVRVTLAR